MADLNIPITGPMKLFSDSKSTISIVHNLVQHNWMKHVRIDRNFMIEIKNRTIALSYILTKSQEANVLTKVLQKSSFNICISKLGMTDIYSPV